jgi:hypothetical protein
MCPMIQKDSRQYLGSTKSSSPFKSIAVRFGDF